MLRVVTSLNWLIGTLALGGAVLLPYVADGIQTASARTAAAATVSEIVKAQKQAVEARSPYAVFRAGSEGAQVAKRRLSVDLASDQFQFDSYVKPDGTLVVRAFTAPGAVQRGELPPMLYRFTLGNPSEDGSGQWQTLSGKKAGLMGLPDTLQSLF